MEKGKSGGEEPKEVKAKSGDGEPKEVAQSEKPAEKKAGSPEKKPAESTKGPLAGLLEDKRRLYGGLAAAALLIVAIVLLVSSGGGDDASSDQPGAPEIVSVDELREAVSGAEPPVYWAGEENGAELELSQLEEGRSYVRYLTGDAEAGDERADFLTVGTYAQANPVTVLKKQGKQPGGVIATAPGGATVYFNRNQPHSVYLAYPGVEAEIEVYDPSFTRALRLVNSGQIIPAG